MKKCAFSSFLLKTISSIFAGNAANLIVKISLEFRAWRMVEGALGVDTTNWILNPTTFFPINSYETTTFPNTLLLNSRLSSFNTMNLNPGRTSNRERERRFIFIFRLICLNLGLAGIKNFLRFFFEFFFIKTLYRWWRLECIRLQLVVVHGWWRLECIRLQLVGVHRWWIQVRF